MTEDKNQLLEEPTADGRVTFHFLDKVEDQAGVPDHVVVWEMKDIKHWGPSQISPYLIQVCAPGGSHFYNIANISQIVVKSNSKEYVENLDVWRFNQQLFNEGQLN